jgi:hypothetical protein
MRALIMMLLIATPSILLPGTSPETQQVVAVVAICCGFLTFFEYSSPYPGLVEFRFAPPYNRMRVVSLFLTVFLLTVMARGQVQPTAMTDLVTAVGRLIGEVIDFPYSPVRLVRLLLPPDATPAQQMLLAGAAGLAYLISLVTIAIFLILLKVFNWPVRHGPFNVWTNLPNFDPTVSGDVVEQLVSDSRINVMLGFALPFITPLFALVASEVFNPYAVVDPQTMIWTMSIWAFLPASLFMRGIAMGRIAEMLERKRQSRGLAEGRLAPV